LPEKKLQDIEAFKARIEICTLKARHLRMLDTKEWGQYADLLIEDFVLDVSQSTNTPVIRGRDAALTRIQASVGGVITVHQAHPPGFDYKGDEAHVVWAIQNRVARGPDQPSYNSYGHHHDRWVSQNGKWKLAAQRLTHLHIDVLAPAGELR
jgi:hypothetical protein